MNPGGLSVGWVVFQVLKAIVFLICFGQNVWALTEAEVQRVITQDLTISKLDKHLNRAYNKLLKLLLPEEKERLKQEQRAWILERNNSDSLEKIYRERIFDLYQRASEIEVKHWKGDDEAIWKEIITADETIDRTKAQALLKDCPTLRCRAYDLYFNAQDYQDEEKLDELWLTVNDRATSEGFTGSLLEFIGNSAYFSGNYSGCLEIPMWLFLKHPEILDIENHDMHAGYSYNVCVVTNRDFKNIPAFMELDQIISSLSVESGLSMAELGKSGDKEITSKHNRANDQLLLAPGKPLHLEAGPLSLRNDNLERWSHLGAWNRQQYNRLRELFSGVAYGLQHYYNSHKDLQRDEPYAGDHLNDYIKKFQDPSIVMASENAFEIIVKGDVDLKTLPEKTKEFTKSDWNAALCYAILKNCGTKVLEWLIDQGADVNAVVDNETPLMKAVFSPVIVAFLIKMGAHVDAANQYGKTALFYAIQLKNMDAVKILVEAGASVKTKLTVTEADAEKDLQHAYEREGAIKLFPDQGSLRNIRNFTPLDYAREYGGEEITAYLDPRA
jgi:hypothetical protein